MNAGNEVLRAWTDHGPEDASAELVARQIGFASSAGVRKVAGDCG